jgi:hypothetical protein
MEISKWNCNRLIDNEDGNHKVICTSEGLANLIYKFKDEFYGFNVFWSWKMRGDG